MNLCYFLVLACTRYHCIIAERDNRRRPYLQISFEIQNQALIHELDHIRYGDFESEESADEIEIRNHARNTSDN